MEIEVIIEGKGSITIKREVESDLKDVKKLVDHAAGTLHRVKPRPTFGFGSGSYADTERSDEE